MSAVDDGRDIQIFSCDVHNLLYDVSATSTVRIVTFNLLCCCHTEARAVVPQTSIQIWLSILLQLSQIGKQSVETHFEQ